MTFLRSGSGKLILCSNIFSVKHAIELDAFHPPIRQSHRFFKVGFVGGNGENSPTGGFKLPTTAYFSPSVKDLDT